MQNLYSGKSLQSKVDPKLLAKRNVSDMQLSVGKIKGAESKDKAGMYNYAKAHMRPFEEGQSKEWVHVRDL